MTALSEWERCYKNSIGQFQIERERYNDGFTKCILDRQPILRGLHTNDMPDGNALLIFAHLSLM